VVLKPEKKLTSNTFFKKFSPVIIIDKFYNKIYVFAHCIELFSTLAQLKNMRYDVTDWYSFLGISYMGILQVGKRRPHKKLF